MENIIYYLCLYALVFSIRYFKLINENGGPLKNKRYEMLHVGLEMVYTASGLVIALILNVPRNWIPAVLSAYLVVVIFSALLEMSAKTLSNVWKGFMHSGIIILVVVATILSYTYVIPKVDINGNPKKSEDGKAPREYFIVIPYKDLSLNRHVGFSKISDRCFIYETRKTAPTKDSAISLGVITLIKDTMIKPMYSDNPNDIVIERKNAIAIETYKLVSTMIN